MEKKNLTGNTMETAKKETAEVQAVSGKETAAAGTEVTAAPKKNVSPEVFLQYREYEVNMEAVADRVKAHYYAKGHPSGSIEDMQIYVKPEDFTAYYVINDGVVGKVNLF
ncbi:MAG: hypothetical protein K2J99_01910 [Lachnospiraceae bacterium]|nr:hypothetical protein [Lachnospiraceae bacterium]